MDLHQEPVHACSTALGGRKGGREEGRKGGVLARNDITIVGPSRRHSFLTPAYGFSGIHLHYNANLELTLLLFSTFSLF